MSFIRQHFESLSISPTLLLSNDNHENQLQLSIHPLSVRHKVNLLNHYRLTIDSGPKLRFYCNELINKISGTGRGGHCPARMDLISLTSHCGGEQWWSVVSPTLWWMSRHPSTLRNEREIVRYHLNQRDYSRIFKEYPHRSRKLSKHYYFHTFWRVFDINRRWVDTATWISTFQIRELAFWMF